MIYEPDDMLTLVQAAALLNLGTATIRELCDSGEIPSIVKGAGTRRVHRNIRYGALLEWRQRKEAESTRQQRRDAHAVARAFARSSASGPPGESPYLTAQRTVGRGRGLQRRSA